MIITGMAHFESVCKKKLVEWYNKNDDMYHTQQRIDLSNVFVVWSCKTLQNYKCLVSTTVSGDGDQVSQNISQEADNFNVTRKLTVLNARTDTILLNLTGTFALKNNSDNELEVIIETAEGKYQKDYVYLNDYTMYVVEDVSGADVDKYHYEINFLPEWGLKVTHNE